MSRQRFGGRREYIVKVFYEAIHYAEIKDDDREETKKELLARIRHFRLLMRFYAPAEMQSYADALMRSQASMTKMYSRKSWTKQKMELRREAGVQFSKREGLIREAGEDF